MVGNSILPTKVEQYLKLIREMLLLTEGFDSNTAEAAMIQAEIRFYLSLIRIDMKESAN